MSIYLPYRGRNRLQRSYDRQRGWLKGWSFRKSLSLSRASGAVSNYQMKIVVNRSSGSDSGGTVYIGPMCASDYDDIRFTLSNGETLIDYWIESASSSTATIWVEFPAIGTGATTFYMYYGGPEASVSSGANTFLLFDHFDGEALDGDKWQACGNHGGAGSNSVGSSILTLSVTNSEYDVASKASISENGIRIRSYNKFVSATRYAHLVMWKSSDSAWTVTPPEHYRFCTYGGTPKWYYIREFANPSWIDHSTGTNPTIDANYHIMEVLDDGNNKHFYYDGTEYSGAAADTTRSSGYIHLGVWGLTGYGTPQHLIDWVFVGKYVATEPAWGSWGSKELR